MEFLHVGQAGLELLTSRDLPTSASQSWDYRHEPPCPANLVLFVVVVFQHSFINQIFVSNFYNFVFCFLDLLVASHNVDLSFTQLLHFSSVASEPSNFLHSIYVIIQKIVS